MRQLIGLVGASCVWLVLACSDDAPARRPGADTAGNSSVAGSVSGSVAGSDSGSGAGNDNGATAGSASGSVAGGSSVGNDTPLSGYLHAYAAAYCKYLERCWPSFTRGLTGGCAPFLENTLAEQSSANIASAVSDGRVDYHSELLPACLDSISSASCSETAFAPCTRVFVGTLAAGQDCTLDAECVGLQCTVNGACPGTCGAPGQVGAVCDRQNRCAPELACVLDDATGLCTATGTEGEACSDDAPCRGLLYCLEGSCVGRDEVTAAKLGELCDYGGEPRCANDLHCTRRLEGAAKVARCEAGVASGAACAYAWPDQCPAGEYCHITSPATAQTNTGACQTIPKLGEECRYGDFWSAPCAADLACNVDTKLCAESRHLNQACTADADCASTFCAANGTCQSELECEASAKATL